MKIRYRVLQARWSGGGEWFDWGFLYECDSTEDDGRELCWHHNLDELQCLVRQINERIRTEAPTLADAECVLADCQDVCRLQPEIHTYRCEEKPVSAALLDIESTIFSPQEEVCTVPEERIRIFSGRSNRPLAHAITQRLGVSLSAVSVDPFPDSELHIQVDEAVRRKDVFIVQPCSAPVNDHLMELLLTIDALRRASARSITAVVPYFPYARQERMSKGREAISARVVATMLESMGVDRVIYIDIHAEATQGFFTVPVDRLQSYPIFVDFFRSKPFIDDAVIVSPDVGRARLAGKYAQALDCPLVLMHKRRTGQRVETSHVVGDVRGKIPIVIDDILASGSVLQQIPELFKKGAQRKVYLGITHPVLLPSALERLDADWLEELVVSDTVLVPPPKRHPKLRIVSVSPMLAYAIRGIYEGSSISPLWDPDAPRKLGFYEDPLRLSEEHR